MMICDVMCSAESEYVIYFLLAAYLETTHFGASLPEWLTKLPLAGFADVEARFQSMLACKAKFAWLSDRPAEKTRDIAQEAMQVFETASVRLNFLKRMGEAVFMTGFPAAGRSPVGQLLRSKRDPFMSSQELKDRTETTARCRNKNF
jgi:hypothetical protein